jgi:hypothetical protein
MGFSLQSGKERFLMKREDVTFQDKINELRLDIRHPNNRGICFVFVEGDTDIRLYRKLFNIDTCKVENIPGGNIKLEECVTNLVEVYPLMIGIRDADFINLEEDDYTVKNMFITDYHDIEMTMIAQEEILNSLMHEYTDIHKRGYNSFIDEVVKSIQQIGYLKWVNCVENLELEFNFGFQDLISLTNYEINFDEYIARVIAKSAAGQSLNAQTLKEKINQLIAKKPDLFQLTNGHDLLKVLAKIFRDKFGQTGLTDSHLASSFRMMFTVAHFEKTNLYNLTSSWASENNCDIY